MNNYPGGVWPVMLTPFTKHNQVDEAALRRLVDWYIDSGVKGLFASCQSSEIFFLSAEERVRIAEITVDQAKGRVPVVASGHVADAIEQQAQDIQRMAQTGVDAVILITNRLAGQHESDDVWLQNLDKLLSLIEPSIRLGFYECPHPYKRLMSERTIKACADSGRFYFMKDTCCDMAMIRERVKLIEGSNLKLYNANTTTLLDSLLAGGHGYSGIMANFHPELYVWLTENFQKPEARQVQDVLTLASLIERQLYPVNAKYHHVALENTGFETTACRVKSDADLTETFKDEVRQMDRVCNDAYRRVCKP